MDQGWYESETAWWAKHQHAQTHRERLRVACAQYQSTSPLEVRAEPTEVPGQTAYRLFQSTPIPVAISLIVGDLVHCLRSSLDSLVFGMVRHRLGGDMAEEEERACQFPICSSPKDFTKFVARPQITRIMDDRVRFALHGVQPFYRLQNMKLLGVEGANALSYVDDSRFHPLTSVARLSNIDKHRRLTVAAWWPSLIYWTTKDEEDRGEHQWRSVGSPPWDHDEIIGYMTSTGPEPKVVHQFHLVITDATTHLMDRWARRDLPEQADEWLAGVDRALRQMIRDYTQPPAHVDGGQPSTAPR